MTPHLYSRFATQRRQEVLEATRQLAPVALALVIIVWPFNFVIFSNRLAERALGCSLSILLCLVVTVASRRMRSPSWAVALGVGFTTALGVLSLWALSLNAVS